MAPKRNKRSTASMAIAQAIINEYQPKNADEMQEAIKDIFGPMFEAMLQGEMLGIKATTTAPKARTTAATAIPARASNPPTGRSRWKSPATGMVPSSRE